MLVRLDARCSRTSGHLWWQRWSQPRDEFELWIYLDGDFTDAYVSADDLKQELHDWQATRFRYCGESLNLAWTSPEESAHLRRTQFGDDG